MSSTTVVWNKREIDWEQCDSVNSDGCCVNSDERNNVVVDDLLTRYRNLIKPTQPVSQNLELNIIDVMSKFRASDIR